MLTDRQIAKAGVRAASYHLADRAGLRLAVRPRGRRVWQLRAEILEKPAILTLGYWPELSVRAARRRAHAARQAIAAGHDPRQTRQAMANVTVASFASRWLREVVSRNRKSIEQVERLLKRDILPSLGRLPIQKVEFSDIRLLVFRKRDQGSAAAAVKLRDALERMFRYAVTCGLILENPVSRLDRKVLGRLRARTRSLSAAELTLFFRHLPKTGSRNALALELLLLTLARKGELLGAQWKEIDLEAGTWEVPAEKSKSHLVHVVYLSERARAIFGILWPLNAERPGAAHSHSGTRRLSPDDYVLPSQNSSTQPMAETTLNKAIARVGWGMPKFVPHDLRRTASTILNEKRYDADAIEKALNHAVRPGVRGIYNKAQYADERKQMLADWAEWLEGVKNG